MNCFRKPSRCSRIACCSSSARAAACASSRQRTIASVRLRIRSSRDMTRWRERDAQKIVPFSAEPVNRGTSLMALRIPPVDHTTRQYSKLRSSRFQSPTQSREEPSRLSMFPKCHLSALEYSPIIQQRSGWSRASLPMCAVGRVLPQKVRGFCNQRIFTRRRA